MSNLFKNVGSAIWDTLLTENLDRLLSPYRSEGDIALYTALELMILAVLIVSLLIWLALVRYDRRRAREKRIARRSYYRGMREERERQAHNRLMYELEPRGLSRNEYVGTAGESEDFVMSIHRECPEIFQPQTLDK